MLDVLEEEVVVPDEELEDVVEPDPVSPDDDPPLEEVEEPELVPPEALEDPPDEELLELVELAELAELAELVELLELDEPPEVEELLEVDPLELVLEELEAELVLLELLALPGGFVTKAEATLPVVSSIATASCTFTSSPGISIDTVSSIFGGPLNVNISEAEEPLPLSALSRITNSPAPLVMSLSPVRTSTTATSASGELFKFFTVPANVRPPVPSEPPPQAEISRRVAATIAAHRKARNLNLIARIMLLLAFD